MIHPPRRAIAAAAAARSILAAAWPALELAALSLPASRHRYRGRRRRRQAPLSLGRSVICYWRRSANKAAAAQSAASKQMLLFALLAHGQTIGREASASARARALTVMNGTQRFTAERFALAAEEATEATSTDVGEPRASSRRPAPLRRRIGSARLAWPSGFVARPAMRAAPPEVEKPWRRAAMGHFRARQKLRTTDRRCRRRRCRRCCCCCGARFQSLSLLRGIQRRATCWRACNGCPRESERVSMNSRGVRQLVPALGAEVAAAVAAAAVAAAGMWRNGPHSVHKRLPKAGTHLLPFRGAAAAANTAFVAGDTFGRSWLPLPALLSL